VCNVQSFFLRQTPGFGGGQLAFSNIQHMGQQAALPLIAVSPIDGDGFSGYIIGEIGHKKFYYFSTIFNRSFPSQGYIFG
jgi:hypothetical protein